MQTLTFDIETIPQENPTDIQIEEILRKIKNAKDKDPELSEHALKNKIMSTSPYFGKIVCIGLHIIGPFETSGSTTSLIGSESDILKSFWNILKDKNLTYVSYNGLSFDVPFIVKRSMHHGIKVTNRSFLNLKRFQTSPHFDVKEIISSWDRYAAPTLHLACDLVGVPTPKSGDVKADGVYDAYKAGEIDKIAEYCVKDVEATYAVYKALQGYY